MKKIAIFIGGLLMLPAFAEVAPVFYDDLSEYSDVVYDEYGNPIFEDTDYESDSDLDVDADVTKPSVTGARNTSTTRTNTNRTTIGRNVPTNAGGAGRASNANSSRVVAARTTSNSSPRSNSAGSRSVTSRGTTPTAATRTTTDVAATRAAAARATGGAGRAASTTRVGGGNSTVARTAASGRVATTSRVATSGTRVNRAATNAAVALNNSKVMSVGTGTGTTQKVTSIGATDGALYNANRVSVAAGRSSANTSRVPAIRMASSGSISTAEDTLSITATNTTEMDELAELTDYCKAQYAACMDNYCNVLDDNQGRCSCSANIKNYAQAEAALKSATEELQEVAQKIQYIGLSAREVETLFNQTEAELKMQSVADTSQLKTSLDKVRDMIIEVQSGTASSSDSSFMSFDLSGLLDFTIDSTGFDLSSFLGGLTGTSGVSNQRGEELFKTATNRCKANVLRSCTAQGVDASLITNAYDLEIDKECIAYERSLNDSNDQMVATVRNAKSVLQKARLLVEQSKNEYDMRGCINALDSCMQDEYVCGSDYEKCLDPSGRYIVNGEIVIGSDPGRAVNGIGDNEGATGVLNGDICSMNLYNVWNYNGSTAGQTTANCKNAWNSWAMNGSANGDLADYIEKTVTSSSASDTTARLGMSQYIQSKIGWKGTGKDGDKNYGMCMSVLNKCQDYTYTGTGSSRKYDPTNEVVKQYLSRILVQIKAKQDEILSEHASGCITDVTTCLSQNNYPFDEVSENAVAANIAVNACRAQIVTCMSVNGYSVANPTPSDMSSWVCGITGNPDCAGDVTPTPGGGGDTPTNTCSIGNLSACTTASLCNGLNSTSVSWCAATNNGAKACRLSTQCYSPSTTCSIGNLSACTTASACNGLGNTSIAWCDNACKYQNECTEPETVTYAITYAKGNCTGTQPSAQSGLLYGTVVTLPTNVASSTQTLSYWTCNGNTVNGNTITITSNTNCTATCVAAQGPTHNIYFMNNGATACNKTFTQGSTSSFSCSFASSTFWKWCTQQNCGGACGTGSNITLSGTETGDVTYYACYYPSCSSYTGESACNSADGRTNACHWCSNGVDGNSNAQCVNYSTACKQLEMSYGWDSVDTDGDSVELVGNQN